LKRLVFILTILIGCIDPYNPPVIDQEAAILVVDGFINTSGESTIRLSRSQSLSEMGLAQIETGAILFIEDESGTKFFLSENEPGEYVLPFQAFSADKYKLNIQTQNLKEYSSDFVTINQSPPIDSLAWSQGKDSEVQINITTHDTENEVGFYRWTFEETWLYTSAYQSLFTFNFETKQVALREDDIFNCFRNLRSNDILIESTTRLSENVVSNFPLKSIRAVDERLRYKYSMLVKQQAISDESYRYWQQLKKNNENLGTLTAPIPAIITGNIKNNNDQQEVVVGYFEISSVTTARIFISHEDLIPILFYETPYRTCEIFDLLNKDIPNFVGSYLLIDAITNGPVVIGYHYASTRCVDCQLTGGTTTKPDFWP